MYQRDDHILMGAGGGAAALRAPAFGRLDPHPRRRVSLVVDLGEAIGSPRWFRGLATLGAMTTALVHVAPGLPPLPGLVPTPLAHAAEEEMRAIGVAPLALGADSGRALAPTDLAAPLASTPDRPRLDLVATMRGGDGLARMLAREGARPEDAVTVAALAAAETPSPTAGTRVAITLGRRAPGAEARPIERVAFRARLDMALAIARQDGRLVLVRQPIAVDRTPMRLSGPVGASLYRAARDMGVPLDVLADYLRAVAKRVAIDEIAAADRFDMVFEHARAATGEVETGRLLYAGLAHDGGMVRLLRWTADGREQWFDAAGTGERKQGLALPVSGGRLTSSFGMRFHPILGYSRMHQGVDLAAPSGTPIVAASDGRVAFAGWHGGHGNYVQLVHDGGMATAYGHMSRFVVRPGESVRQGQLIGYVGSTGLSTGPHCHFEVYRNGVAIDPATASFATVMRVAAKDIPAFRAAFARFAALPMGGAMQIAGR